ncbi:hypothetical protein CDL15_Pgr010378 [Punica granatum]|nr:hypothetical protein CDL15_Pgr010378 [Punica granatum]
MDKDVELVKYMSSLPSYLERGINTQEGAFNIGVLDWRNLEKWQHNQKIKLQRPRGASVSCSDSSASFLTDGFPSHSTYHSHSAVHEKMHGVQSHRAASKDLHGVKSVDWNRKDKIQGIDQTLEDHGESQVDSSKRNLLDNRILQKNDTLHSRRSAGLAHSPRKEVNFQQSGNQRRTHKVQEPNDGALEKELTGRPDRVVTCFPRDVHTGLSEESASSTNTSSTRLEETSQMSGLEKSRDSGVRSDIPQSYFLPCKLDRYDSGPSTCSSSKPIAVAAPASLLPETPASKDRRKCQLSPGKRSLEPILRADTKSLFQNIEPLTRSSVSVDRISGPSNSPRLWSSRLKCCRTVDVIDSQLGKSGTFVEKALLQVACKNGRPLFTFALNTESDILAATVKKKSTSRKSSSKWSYTVFKVPAVKREKASKMKEGGKGETPNCYPMVVSHLNVSESNCSKSTRQREFVLLPAEPRNDELAAIVVQMASRANQNTTALHGGYRCESLQVGSKGHSLNVTPYSDVVENVQDQQRLFVNKNCMSATVILPSGVHSLPSEGGEPSSLIERWKSGGSCDCGGWDVGCKLRILVNQNLLCSELSSSKAYYTSGGSVDKLAVFTPQVHEQEDQPVLSLFQSKDGIYSVEFNSSISELQAFSICIAVLDCSSPK